jgi:hypothetical protein
MFEWMIDQQLNSVQVDEGQNWYFSFEGSGSIAVHCPWRLLIKNIIQSSSDDHEQQFGLPEPINSAMKATKLLTGHPIRKVEVREGTLDFVISFTGEMSLEIIPLSSGYESWHVVDPKREETIAQGHGRLFQIKP